MPFLVPKIITKWISDLLVDIFFCIIKIKCLYLLITICLLLQCGVVSVKTDETSGI